MTEDELEHKINEYGEAYYHGEGGGEEEIKAAILAAFAEMRAERDAALAALKTHVEAVAVNQELLHAVSDECDLLREAVKRVEWITIDSYGQDWDCPWCHGMRKYGHKPDCLRQRALVVKP